MSVRGECNFSSNLHTQRDLKELNTGISRHTGHNLDMYRLKTEHLDTRALSQRGPGLARFGIIDDRLSEAPQAHDREAGTIIHELHDGLDVARTGVGLSVSLTRNCHDVPVSPQDVLASSEKRE